MPNRGVAAGNIGDPIGVSLVGESGRFLIKGRRRGRDAGMLPSYAAWMFHSAYHALRVHFRYTTRFDTI